MHNFEEEGLRKIKTEQTGMIAKAPTAYAPNASVEVMQELRRLAEQSEMLVGAVVEKLNKYSPCHPNEAKEQKCEPMRTYPPYFDQMRSELERIENSLECIERIVQSTEL
jgi:hypothetical protein